MWKLLQIELYKIFKRPRTYIPFAAIFAMILIIQLGLKFDGKSYLLLLLSSLSDSFYVPYAMILNGYLVAFVILNTLLIQVPLLVALVAGDMVAGEANMGTLRLLITRPVSRPRRVSVSLAPAERMAARSGARVAEATEITERSAAPVLGLVSRWRIVK